MGRITLRNIFLTSLLGLMAGGCAGLASQSDIKFPGYHAAAGITPAVVERTIVPREEIAADVMDEILTDYRYRSQYGITDYNLLSHIYGPYAHLSWRDRHRLEYQRRLGRMGYGLFYDPYYDPYGYGYRGSYWGSSWYDPWGWNSWYGDPFYYSSRYGYGYSYGFGSGYHGYHVYGGTSSKGTTVKQRRGRSRKDGAGSTFGSWFSGNPSYAEAPSSSGRSRAVTKARSSNRNSGKSVKSAGGRSHSGGTKSSGSSGKTTSRRSKRKN